MGTLICVMDWPTSTTPYNFLWSWEGLFRQRNYIGERAKKLVQCFVSALTDEYTENLPEIIKSDGGAERTSQDLLRGGSGVSNCLHPEFWRF